MANKRNLKKGINVICQMLFSECVAVSLYGPEDKKAHAEDQSVAVMKLQDHFIRRVSHPEPGVKAKDYYKELTDKFREQVTEILDHINS